MCCSQLRRVRRVGSIARCQSGKKAGKKAGTCSDQRVGIYDEPSPPSGVYICEATRTQRGHPDSPRFPLHAGRFGLACAPVTPCVRVLALWLAVLWLPMTMHCQLAGMRICCAVGSCCEDDACAGEPDACHDVACCGNPSNHHSGTCKIVESGNYFLKKATLALPAAASVAATVGPAVPALRRGLPPVATLTEATGAPPGWGRVWQFVFRAAVAPRAPSAVG